MTDRLKYNPHMHHRMTSKSSEKSQWEITIEEEEAAFTKSQRSGWLVDKEGWGLHLKESKVKYLGSAPDSRKLVFAKFVDSDGTNVWHGYPGDQRKTHDRPNTIVLQKWLDVLPPAKVRKLTKGQKCTL